MGISKSECKRLKEKIERLDRMLDNAMTKSNADFRHLCLIEGMDFIQRIAFLFAPERTLKNLDWRF